MKVCKGNEDIRPRCSLMNKWMKLKHKKKIWKISLQVPFRHFLGNIGTLGRGMRYHLPNSSKSVPRISSKLLHISFLIPSYYCHVTSLTSPPGGTRVSFFFLIYREISRKDVEAWNEFCWIVILSSSTHGGGRSGRLNGPGTHHRWSLLQFLGFFYLNSGGNEPKGNNKVRMMSSSRNFFKQNLLQQKKMTRDCVVREMALMTTSHSSRLKRLTFRDWHFERFKTFFF